MFEKKKLNPEKKENPKYSNIIIDGNNLFYRALLTENDMASLDISHKTLIENPIRGFLKRLDSIANDYGHSNTKIFVLWDNPNSLYFKRREVDASYKHRREKNATTRFINLSMNQVSNILKYYKNNLYQIRIKEYEADDLVKPLIESLNISYHNTCLVISNDLDWSRGITDNISWFNYNTLYTQSVFKSKYGFFPTEEKIIMYKSIRGDSSDCIEVGVPNLPEPLLLHIVEHAKTLKDLKLLILYDKTLSKHWKDKIEDNWHRLEINHQLVSFCPLTDDLKNHVVVSMENQLYLKIIYGSLKLQDKYLSIQRENKSEFFISKVKL